MSRRDMNPTEARIYAPAEQYGLVAERLPVDDWADKVAELSDAEVPPDPVMDLIVTMQRKGIIIDQESAVLYGDYVQACCASSPSRPIRERLVLSLSLARQAGPFAPGDHKRETDEMWGDE